ncbi:MAG: glycoside hydrolase family 2 TIM barrel-domain containing protein [Planctomycetota bacterium]
MRHIVRAPGSVAALLLLTIGAHAAGSAAAAQVPADLALRARASASETYQDLTTEKGNDGNVQTRWSGIPGHNEGIWFELGWDAPVRVGEVVIRQYDRYVMELDLQVWDAAAAGWRTLQHCGQRGERLPLVVVSRFEPQEVARLRIGNITNGPSFTEVEVYERPYAYGLVTCLASDLRGNLIGVSTDGLGAAPAPGATVRFSGQSRAGPWHAVVESDANGLFSVPLPLRLSGRFTAETTAGDQRVVNTFDAGDFPWTATPRGLEDERRPLPGPWRFAPDPPQDFWQVDFDDASWRPIEVPGHWEMQDFHPLSGIGGYRTRFVAPPGRGLLKLVFGGVYSGAEVWVNGTRLTYHEGGATPFECDITGIARPGDNVLALRVTEDTVTSERLDQMSSYADFPLGGIIRQVSLLRVPAVHVGALVIDTELVGGDAALRGELKVVNESDQPAGPVEVRFALRSAAGEDVSLGIEPIRIDLPVWGFVPLSFGGMVPSPQWWNAEQPSLYTLVIELRAAAALIQRFSQRIGFRETTIEGRRLLINGRPVKIRGTCHHDSHPLLGRAVSGELTRQDLQMMKAANLNAVRTSHYPPLPELLDIADELGLYVEDEAPFCWVGVSNDLRLAPRIIQLTAELVARDRNHASVFMWSLCNESEFGWGFERSHEWLRRADPSRPAAAATSAWLDIATLHNPLASSRIEEHESLEKPLLFDESLAPFQGIWGDAFEIGLDPGIRDYYIAPLIDVYEHFMRSAVTHGSLIWCWADDLFCVPGRGLEYGRGATQCHFIEESYALSGRGIVGDAPWGLVDGWRRPKPEFWLVKKLHSPIRVAERPLELPAPGQALRVPVENHYDFENLAALRISWRIGEQQGDVEVDVPARSKGELVIAPAAAPQSGNVLELTFRTVAGDVVDQFRVPLGEEQVLGPLPAATPGRPLVIADESTLAGPAIRVVGENIELAFDQRSGRLRRCVGFGQPLLLELPAIHVLPAGRPFERLPDGRTWRLGHLDVQPDGDRVRVVIEGSYERFTGGYVLRISPDGELEATCSFDYAGPETWAREIGWRTAMPRTCDRLEWERRAEWNVYPEDHIGRPHGVARAFAEHTAAVPPSWPWSQDNWPLGSNDFRSTKRNMHWASLGYAGGPAVCVIGEGRRHVRATVETDRTGLHVNDWYGGTAAGLWEWEQNYGKGERLAPGERIESTLRLRIVLPPSAPAGR